MTQTVNQTTKKLTFAEYLVYEGKPDVLYELYRGILIEMPTPTGLHTRIADFLKAKLLRYFVMNELLLVAIRLTGVRTEENSSRIPDVVVCSKKLVDGICDRGCAGVLDLDDNPVLVIEVTGDNWRTDYNNKKAEYALINIPEYWIVDPNKSRIKVCSDPQNEDLYDCRDFHPGEMVKSVQFPDFVFPVAEILSPPSEYDIIRSEFQQAESVRLRAETAEKNADAKRLRAESERLRAETAEKNADAERLRAENLAQKLREMGVNIEDV